MAKGSQKTTMLHANLRPYSLPISFIHSDKDKTCHAQGITVTKEEEDSYVNSWLLSSKAVNKVWRREDENWEYYLLNQLSLA